MAESTRLYSDTQRNPDLSPFREWLEDIDAQATALARQAVEQNIDLYDAERYITHAVTLAFSVALLEAGLRMRRAERAAASENARLSQQVLSDEERRKLEVEAAWYKQAVACREAENAELYRLEAEAEVEDWRWSRMATCRDCGWMAPWRTLNWNQGEDNPTCPSCKHLNAML